MNKSRQLTSGGGIAGGHLFNYTAVESNSVITGHFMWNGTEYDIVCVKKNHGAAIIYLKGGLAVKVMDEKQRDRITAPFAAGIDCSLETTGSETAMLVDGGNLTVYE